MNELGRAIAFMDAVETRAVARIVPFSHGEARLHDELWQVYDLNHLQVTTAGAKAEELAAEAERIQGPLGHTHRRVDLWDEAEAQRLEPGFVALGWKPGWLVVMPHRHEHGRTPAAEVQEVGQDLLKPVWEAQVRADPSVTGGEETVQQLSGRNAVVGAAVPTRYFAVLADGRPVSFCELYSENGTGQIESVMTLPEYRGRGLATAVVLTALQESRASGNDFSFLVAEENDWPKELYAKLGFETVGRYAHFLRKVE